MTFKPTKTFGSRAAIVTTVIALHLGVAYGYWLWKGKVHPPLMVIHVKIIPADHDAQGPRSSPGFHVAP